jgi:hypothetical protein
MRHDRDYWRLHVEAWRASGLSQGQYSKKHGMRKRTLGHWAWKLGRTAAASQGSLVEVGRAPLAEQSSARPIELMVEGRYLLRVWPGTRGSDIREVVTALEPRR